MTQHLLEGHHLVYQILAGDTVLHSELVSARSILDFPSLDIPPYVRQVEVSITHYGPEGEHISMVRRILHPKAVKAAVNAMPWRMLDEYLSTVITNTPE